MKTSDLQPIIDAINRLASTRQERMWDHIGTVAVVLTLGVLIWYTIETYLLRRAAQKQIEETDRLWAEAQRQTKASQEQNELTANLLRQAQLQNEIAVQPVITVYTDVVNNRRRLVFENVGLGPAFNTVIENIVWGTSNKITLYNESKTIKPGLPQKLILGFDQKAVDDVSEFVRILVGEKVPQPIKIKVHCVSLNLTSYSYTFSCATSDQALMIQFEKMDRRN